MCVACEVAERTGTMDWYDYGSEQNGVQWWRYYGAERDRGTKYDYVAEYRGMTVVRLRCGTGCDMSCDTITVRNEVRVVVYHVVNPITWYAKDRVSAAV